MGDKYIQVDIYGWREVEVELCQRLVYDFSLLVDCDELYGSRWQWSLGCRADRIAP
jgi:hypothetical protein